jgi:hypothetical protein
MQLACKVCQEERVTLWQTDSHTVFKILFFSNLGLIFVGDAEVLIQVDGVF